MKGINTILIGFKNIFLFTFSTTNQSEIRMNKMITSQTLMFKAYTQSMMCNFILLFRPTSHLYTSLTLSYEVFSLLDYIIFSFIGNIFRYSNISEIIPMSYPYIWIRFRKFWMFNHINVKESMN